MSATFFSPTSKMTGSALFVSFNSKDASIFMKFVKQTSWDDKTKRGAFKDGKYINFKLSIDEASDIIRAIRDKDECSFYHTFDGDVTTGKFNHYSIEKDGKTKKGFGLTVKKDPDEYKCGFNYGAAERLAQYLEFALSHIFSADYAKDKKDAEERLANKKAEESKSSNKSEKSKPSQEETKPEKSTEEDDGELF